MSKSMGDQGPRIAHLVHAGKGGLAGEIADLRSDTDRAMALLEARDASLDFPELDYIDGAGPAAAGGDMVVVGRNLLDGQTFASLTLGASLDIIMRVPGEAGNDVIVEVVDTGGAGPATYVWTPATKTLTIDLVGTTPDEDTIATAINDAGVGAPVRANSGGGAAFGTVAAQNLSGGTGLGWSCTVGGFDAPIKFDTGAATSNANLTETQATVTVPALAPIVATDKAHVYATVNGVRAELGAVAVE